METGCQLSWTAEQGPAAVRWDLLEEFARMDVIMWKKNVLCRKRNDTLRERKIISCRLDNKNKSRQKERMNSEYKQCVIDKRKAD